MEVQSPLLPWPLLPSTLRVRVPEERGARPVSGSMSPAQADCGVQRTLGVHDGDHLSRVASFPGCVDAGSGKEIRKGILCSAARLGSPTHEAAASSAQYLPSLSALMADKDGRKGEKGRKGRRWNTGREGGREDRRGERGRMRCPRGSQHTQVGPMSPWSLESKANFSPSFLPFLPLPFCTYLLRLPHLLPLSLLPFSFLPSFLFLSSFFPPSLLPFFLSSEPQERVGNASSLKNYDKV